ncbi:hypothetical protein MRBLRH8O_003809 [Agrobacterium radiobacter]|uniref:hypothetical protein n=1 Tax=Agrobacterium radiobacter TaxID=362 RepID=UPI00346594E6
MKDSRRKNFKYTDDMLRNGSQAAKIVETTIRAVAAKLGRRPSHSDLRNNDCGALAGKLSARQIREICGISVFPEPKAPVTWTKSRCEEAVREVWRKLGRRPTHQDLRDHGHSRAVTLLKAADIDLIGHEANLQQNRKRMPVGYWTKETVADAYVQKFAHFAFGPRPFELRQMGEGALKAMIERKYGGFHRFEAKIRARCPGMNFKEKPVTANGIALDSFREVAAYEGILLNLGVEPEEILIHQEFSHTGKRAFPDFIIRNVVVEVVMYARENESQRSLDYFKRLRAKIALYLEAGFQVVEIHPHEVVNADRRAELISSIAAKLGTEGTVHGSGRSMREHGYWSPENVRKEVEALAATIGHFPSYRELDVHGIGSAKKALKQYPRERLAQELDYPLKKKSNGFWSVEKVLEACASLSGDTFPSRRMLEDHPELIAAMKNSVHSMNYWRQLFQAFVLSRRSLKDAA